jgi:acetyl-CoA carboxylase carboxyl transferase subunit alpha
MKAEEIRKKMAELQSLAAEERLDISQELERLAKKLLNEGGEVPDAWNRVTLARHASRPTTLQYVEMIADDFVELHGDRLHGDDAALVGGIARIDGAFFTVIGHQKGRNMKENLHRNYGMAHPEGYRKALRLVKQAEKFRRPVLTFIDTPGAYPGLAAEERGIGEAIARNIKEMSVLQTPIISVIIGEGGSGGALGIAVADRLLMLENTVYSVISPEGFASILLRDAKQAKYAASLMKMTATDIFGFGIADEVVHEPPGGAHNDPVYAADKLKKAVLRHYDELAGKRPDVLLWERSRKIQNLDNFPRRVQRNSGVFRRIFGGGGSTPL